jgi:hypothetical protein
MGHPPSADTSQILFLPLIFEMNAIVFPSGDHVLPPIARVMYSLSIERLCAPCSTCALGLLLSSLGSVIAGGACKVCPDAKEAIMNKITKLTDSRVESGRRLVEDILENAGIELAGHRPVLPNDDGRGLRRRRHRTAQHV